MQLLQKYFGFIVQSLEAKAKQAVCSAVVVVFFNCMLAWDDPTYGLVLVICVYLDST